MAFIYELLSGGRLKQVGPIALMCSVMFCNHQAHHLDEWMTNKLQIFLPVTDQIDIYNQLVASHMSTGPPSLLALFC